MIWFCVISSWIYWIYLSTHTQMLLAQDALGYASLGHQIYAQGFFNDYFITGPNREPIYPLLVAFSLHLEHLSGIAYTQLMAYLGALILLCNQLCLWRILQILNIRPIIIALTLLYLGFSPGINNTAFSLYSEIAAFPFVLPLILISHYYLRALDQSKNTALIFAMIQSILLVYLTMVKASFELIGPCFLLLINIYAWQKYPGKLTKIMLCTITALAVFFIPIIAYKSMNKHYNGNFAVTNRASWALYGNTARRMEPLNQERVLSALAYTPGEGFCLKFFTTEKCAFWSFTASDDFGMTMSSQLQHTFSDQEQINKELLKKTLHKALTNPFQYAFLTTLEGIKMFFWESTQIGFVTYPSWLTDIYKNILFKDILRLIISLLTFGAMVMLWIHCFKKTTPGLIVSIGILTVLYIGTYALFFILTRYALPIAPLFLIAIAYGANFLYNSRHAKH